MSRCEKAAPNATQPPRASNAVRRAWMWLAAYVLVELSVQIFFEWLNAVKGNGHDYPFFDGLVLSFFLGAATVLFIRSLLRREKAGALIYVALIAISLNWPGITTPADLTAKAYFFSTFPDQCPKGSPKPGYRVFLCYTFSQTYWRTALVFNPGDELAAPYDSWPPEFDKEIFENPEVRVDECQKNNTRLLVKHVYSLEDNCWGNTE
jgi:hypothetical protein